MSLKEPLFQLMAWLADDCTGFLNANAANSVCNLVGQCCYGLPTNYSGCRGNGKQANDFCPHLLATPIGLNACS